MPKDYFWIDGVRCDEYGIVLQGPVSFSGTKPYYTAVNVPGKNGELHIYDGSFENVDGSAKCYALQRDGVDRALNAISMLTLMRPGYHRLETTDEPEIYRMAAVVNGPETEVRMRILAPFSISFNCKPQKFLKSGERAIRLGESGAIIRNPGFEAYPKINVYGEGLSELIINGETINFNADFAGHVLLDFETENAFTGNENANYKIKTTGKWPTLKPGENRIEWTGGIEHISLIPNWYVL